MVQVGVKLLNGNGLFPVITQIINLEDGNSTREYWMKYFTLNT